MLRGGQTHKPSKRAGVIYNLVNIKVKNRENIARVAELLVEMGRLSRAEPGCVRFEVYQSASEPESFMLNEWWIDQAALDVHRAAPAFETLYKPKVLPLIERAAHSSKLLV